MPAAPLNKEKWGGTLIVPRHVQDMAERAVEADPSIPHTGHSVARWLRYRLEEGVGAYLTTHPLPEPEPGLGPEPVRPTDVQMTPELVAQIVARTIKDMLG